MLEYMLDTNICIYVIKNRPAALRERFDQLAEALCISTTTLGELPCGAYDMLIAAHARSEGLTLVTNNVREFQRMPGLRIDNWAHDALPAAPNRA